MRGGTAAALLLLVLCIEPPCSGQDRPALRGRRLKVDAQEESATSQAEGPVATEAKRSRSEVNKEQEEEEVVVVKKKTASAASETSDRDARPHRSRGRGRGADQPVGRGRAREIAPARGPAANRSAGKGKGRDLEPEEGHQKGSRPRQRGHRRRPRPRPVYYDYYYDDYYEEDYYEEDYYEEDEEVEANPVSKPKNVFAQQPAEKGQSSKNTDTVDADYGGLIKKLWEEFIKEKQISSKQQGSGKGKKKKEEEEEEYECPPKDASYFQPDDTQCDKYFECNIKGEIKEHLCPDGFVFDIVLEKCDYPVKVNCSGRPLLQEPQPSVNCSRANGFFAWPANISCQSFWDCRQGTAYKQTCPVGVIFDPQLNTCATPDQSSRTECTGDTDTNFFGFLCPNYNPESVLRFGNHERLPHPHDCQQYFSCLLTGGARLATCPRKQVFNNATGNCGDPKDVPGCETYWIEKLKDDKDYEDDD